jgi:acyl carrier protein
MKTEAEIVEFLKESLSGLLQLRNDEILIDVPLDSHYGLGSMDLLTLGGRLEDRLGIELDPEIMFRKKTVQELAATAAGLKMGM